MKSFPAKHVAAVIGIAILASVFPHRSHALTGEKTFGIQTGYNSGNNSGLAGVFFSYRFSQHFRVAPNVQYVFRNEQTDAFLFNCDMQIPFDIIKRFEVYPMAGLCYMSKNIHETVTTLSHTDDVTSRTNKFGLNFGAGVTFKCTTTLKLNLDARYSLVKGGDTTILSVGVGYCF